MSIASCTRRLLQPAVSMVHTLDAAVKFRRLMSKWNAIRLACALQRTNPQSLPVAGNSFRLREGTTDLYTFTDVFLQDSIELFVASSSKPLRIIDCGAHIGCASVFFALRYPESQIVSVEPDEENFALLCHNVQEFDNISPINAAVWDRPAMVGIANPGTNPTGRYVQEATNANHSDLRGLTIPQILEMTGFDRIDILKLDIEAAERRLFSSPHCHEWLSKVSILIVELHDRLLSGCSRAMFRALDRYNYEPTGRAHVLIIDLKEHKNAA